MVHYGKLALVRSGTPAALTQSKNPKSLTIWVNGIEVRAPERVAPAKAAMYHGINARGVIFDFLWKGDGADIGHLAAGNVFLNKTDAIAYCDALMKPWREYLEGGE